MGARRRHLNGMNQNELVKIITIYIRENPPPTDDNKLAIYAAILKRKFYAESTGMSEVLSGIYHRAHNLWPKTMAMNRADFDERWAHKKLIEKLARRYYAEMPPGTRAMYSPMEAFDPGI